MLYLATSPFGSDALQPGKEERKRTSMTASVAERRIKKELQKLEKAGDEVGMTVEVGASNTEWFVTIVGEAPWTCEWHIGSKQSQACAVLSPDWVFFGVRYGFGVPSCVCFLKPCISTSIEPAPVCRCGTFPKGSSDFFLTFGGVHGWSVESLPPRGHEGVVWMTLPS